MDKIYDLIIIGSGPAGLSAAVYAQRSQLNSITIEKNAMSGGQVLTTYEVDNYPGLPGISGFDLSTKLKAHADNLCAVFIEDTVTTIECGISFKTVKCKKNSYKARAVIIATGATHKKLGVKGEEEFSGKGVSYCATCDGMFFKNKTAVVVGGGDVALEDAVYLSRICSKVYIIHRRNEFRGAQILQNKVLKHENIEILWNTEVKEIKGGESISSIVINNNQTGEEKELDADGIFIAIGITPATEIFKGVVDLDENGYIMADENGETSVKGIFAAGDVRTKSLRQIITAANDGANCVACVEKYLEGR